MLDEMFFIIFEFIIPVLLVLLEVDFVNGPEAGHLVLVHLPDVMVLNGKDNEAIGVLFKQGFREHLLGLSTIHVTDLGGGNIL